MLTMAKRKKATARLHQWQDDTHAAASSNKVEEGYDPTYGNAEFIYLTGVANTAVGSWVTYDVDGASALLVEMSRVVTCACATSSRA